MKLKYVVGSVNNNPNYYKFIPYHVRAWKSKGIKFVCFFVSKDPLPDELDPFRENIVHLNSYPDHISDVFIAQMARIFCCSFLENDGFAMVTDMDMLPVNVDFFTDPIKDEFTDEFVYYRWIDEREKQIYICYNAAMPSTWRRIFKVTNVDEMWETIDSLYPSNYEARRGTGWFMDQLYLYQKLVHYPKLIVLNKPIVGCRLEPWNVRQIVYSVPKEKLLEKIQDAHFHTNYFAYEDFLAFFCDKLY
jgi:hypothetical protein